MRRTLTVLTLGLVLGALLMAALPGGAVGQNFLLGQKNIERVVTRLNTKGGLRVDSMRPGSPPLILNTTDVNTPPIQVNSHAKVNMLNADYVDGWSAVELRSTWDWCSNDNLSLSFDCTRDITVPPGGGVVMMSGSVGASNTGSADWIACGFYVDAAPVNSSNRVVTIPATSGKGECASTAARELSAGVHTIKFSAAVHTPSSLDLTEGSAWFIVLPD